jgi:hypothetical protein
MTKTVRYQWTSTGRRGRNIEWLAHIAEVPGGAKRREQLGVSVKTGGSNMRKRASTRVGWATVLVGMAAQTICFSQSTSLPVGGISTDGGSLTNGGFLIRPQDLLPALADSLQAMGSRMTSPDKAQITLAGTVTDGSGSRAAQIIVQAPGYFSYREGQSRAITFDGTHFQTNSGQPTAADEPVLESLRANLPDAVYLQLANGGGLRRIGSHFRTDDGKSKQYLGPTWTVFAFSPKVRPGLGPEAALKQPLFIAIDEQTGLMSDVRVVLNLGSGQQAVTQTQFSNWIQQGNQWIPGRIVRLENGKPTLSFQTQQATVGAALAPLAFQP